MIIELDVEVSDLGSEIAAHDDWAILGLITTIVEDKFGSSFANMLVMHLLNWIKKSYEQVDFEDFVIEIARWADDNG